MPRRIIIKPSDSFPPAPQADCLLPRKLDNFTVVIPTVGRALLQQCLQGIASGTVLPGHLILVDQGCNPQVEQWLHPLGALGLEIKRLHSAQRSPASARNEGLAHVQTTFVVALDDDCIPERNWLETMEIQLRENPSALVTGRLQPAGEGIPPTVVMSQTPCVHHRPSVRIHSPLASANMGFALKTAQLIGAFDPTLFAAEENDWAYRALSIGIPIVFAPEIIVYHFHWRDKNQMAETYRMYAWSQGMFYGKHLRHGHWLMLVRAALSFYRGARDLLYGWRHKDFDLQANGYARMSQIIPGLFFGLRKNNFS